MIKNVLLMAACAASLVVFTACTTQPVPQDTTPVPSESAALGVYQTIDAEEAKRMMDDSVSFVLVDVRTKEEYMEAHIEGALLLPNEEIETSAADILTDKGATILVYCRSGRRSAEAAKKLAEMGYTAIYDFGGIIDWPYGTVSG